MLRRLGPGQYQTRDGRYTISRGPDGSGWAGEWVVQGPDNHTDPLPTLKEAKRILASILAKLV